MQKERWSSLVIPNSQSVRLQTPNLALSIQPPSFSFPRYWATQGLSHTTRTPIADRFGVLILTKDAITACIGLFGLYILQKAFISSTYTSRFAAPHYPITAGSIWSNDSCGSVDRVHTEILGHTPGFIVLENVWFNDKTFCEYSIPNGFRSWEGESTTHTLTPWQGDIESRSDDRYISPQESYTPQAWSTRQSSYPSYPFLKTTSPPKHMFPWTYQWV